MRAMTQGSRVWLAKAQRHVISHALTSACACCCTLFHHPSRLPHATHLWTVRPLPAPTHLIQVQQCAWGGRLQARQHH